MAPGRQSRRWWSPLLVLAALLAASGAALYLLGVAGYRAGWVWCGATFVGAISIAYRRFDTQFPARRLWTMSAAVIAIATTAWLVDHTPLSKARLRHEIATLPPTFSRQLSETTRGHSWCRPTCPEIERVYRSPKTSTYGALLNVAAQLRKRGVTVDLLAVGRSRPQRYLRIAGERYVAVIRAEPANDHLRVTITLSATRDGAA